MYKKSKVLFSRRDYQSNSENIAHALIILAVDCEKPSEEERVLFKKLGQDSVFDVIISDEIEDFIEKNIISSKYEVYNNVESAIKFITQKYNDGCMVKI